MFTYYLFVDLNSCPIEPIFNYLKSSQTQGINYIDIKTDSLLPKYIVIKSMFKDEYFKDKIKMELLYYGYDKKFKILKPLVKELALVHDDVFIF
jgi:hypothetical protein